MKFNKLKFLIYLFIIFFISSSILAFIFYIYKFGGMRLKDFLHFWDFIASDNADWDTFSFLVSGIVSSTFSGITLLLLIVEHVEKNKENLETKKERIILEKEKLAIRYIEDMEKLNNELKVITNYNNQELFELYKQYNEQIEKFIFIKIFLKVVKKNNFTNWNDFTKLSESFPITDKKTNISVTWDSFISFRDLQYLSNFLFDNLIITDLIKKEVLQKGGRQYLKYGLSTANEYAVDKIVLNSNNQDVNNVLHRTIEHFIYAMTSLNSYQEGINYYFLNLLEEQRYFFLFVSNEKNMIKQIKTAIQNTNLLNKEIKYILLQEK